MQLKVRSFYASLNTHMRYQKQTKQVKLTRTARPILSH